jgi:hypothetical protein
MDFKKLLINRRAIRDFQNDRILTLNVEQVLGAGHCQNFLDTKFPLFYFKHILKGFLSDR